MGSQSSYTSQNNDGRRLNRAFMPYGGSNTPGRRLHTSNRDGRSTSVGDTDPPEPPARKRIAVACGRCRQRKIRCSGDFGQNIPCSNCKNAGVTECLFLRVSSRETLIKSEAGSGSNATGFSYNPTAARALARRSAVPPASYMNGSDTSTDDTYRPSSLYVYGERQYYGSMSPWDPNYNGHCMGYGAPANSGSFAVISGDTSPLMPYPWDNKIKSASTGTGIHSGQDHIRGNAAILAHRPAVPVLGPSEFGVPSFGTTASAVDNSLAITKPPTALIRAPQYDPSFSHSLRSSNSQSSLASVRHSSAATTRGGVRVGPITHQSASAGYTCRSDGCRSPLNVKPPFSSPNAYREDVSGGPIFTDQERGAGTQGPPVGMCSYTHDPVTSSLLSVNYGCSSKSPSGKQYVPADGTSSTSQRVPTCLVPPTVISPVALAEENGTRHERYRQSPSVN